MNYDVIIIGAGPAGISAALYAKRTDLNVLIVTKDDSSLNKADLIENYYGLEKAISGKELFEQGIRQAVNLDIKIIIDEIVDIKKDQYFNLIGTKSKYSCKSLIIATGTSRSVPPIEGVKEFTGNGISYCATCDGFFYRGKNIAVIGNGNYAVSEANELRYLANQVTILTDGKEFNERTDLNVITKKIKKIFGESNSSNANDNFFGLANPQLRGVIFDDDTVLYLDGIFIAVGVAGSFNFAKKIGAEIAGNKIVVNEKMETSIPGLYASGDTTGGMLQIAKAVYEGAVAGSEIAKYLRKSR